VLKNVVKWHVFTPAPVHPTTPVQVSQEKKPTKTHGIVPSTKIIKLRAIKGNEKSPWRGFHQFVSHPEEETKSQTYEE
jgi:hypothetical protein